MKLVGKKRTFHIEEDLLGYLKDRAETNYRGVDHELNAILCDLKVGKVPPRVVIDAQDEPEPARGPLKNASGYRGVYPYGKRKWVARIYEDGQNVKIGVFVTPKEAAEAYDGHIRERSDNGPALAPVNFPRKGEQGITDAVDDVIDDENEAVDRYSDDGYYGSLPEEQREAARRAVEGPPPEAPRPGVVRLPARDPDDLKPAG